MNSNESRLGKIWQLFDTKSLLFEYYQSSRLTSVKKRLGWNFSGVNLSGADLTGANLTNANLEDIITDENTKIEIPQ